MVEALVVPSVFRRAVTGASVVAALVAVMAVTASAQEGASDNARGAGGRPGRVTCRGCAPTQRGAGDGVRSARRGAGGHERTTVATVSLGAAHFEDRVDAECFEDPRATVASPRALFRVMYPWFGRRVGPDEPKWTFDLEVQRGSSGDVYDHFVFSFHDGAHTGTIQTVRGGARMGSGTVRVVRRGGGARFQVDGRSEEGEPVHAIFECAAFEGSEAAGG